ncbi:uncharacterized protein BCR38DRAFT_409457 [Pseudomassariella vexata]|uniref:Uncharacterized protein n=1 Tax=Pseudomassariella vexata TaxID=1141098 RepID=A0A1Y2DY86_9PEZI|nr:uncharacterized protein BCR38DRAFT_409457 [Pseudomassariella vexata]ORY64054.1 hypothetical protein BCR38DRAFT_409457 [Pseudomassariella vexata]
MNGWIRATGGQLKTSFHDPVLQLQSYHVTLCSPSAGWVRGCQGNGCRRSDPRYQMSWRVLSHASDLHTIRRSELTRNYGAAQNYRSSYCGFHMCRSGRAVFDIVANLQNGRKLETNESRAASTYDGLPLEMSCSCDALSYVIRSDIHPDKQAPRFRFTPAKAILVITALPCTRLWLLGTRRIKLWTKY